jgi:hypothetical protein
LTFTGLEDATAVKYSSLMATTWEQLAEQAMTLSTDSRARLADRLVESLDLEELGPIDKLWAVEAKRRRDEVRSGAVDTIDGEVALRNVRESLR